MAEQDTFKLVLVRHGESLWNKENKFTGWADVPLSDKGKVEAKAAAEVSFFDWSPFCFFFSHPFSFPATQEQRIHLRCLLHLFVEEGYPHFGYYPGSLPFPLLLS